MKSSMFYQRQYATGYCTAHLSPLGVLAINYAYDKRPAWMTFEECPRTWGTHILFSLENVECI